MFTESDSAHVRTAYFMAGGHFDRGVHVMEIITELRLITGKELSEVLRLVANAIDAKILETIGATVMIVDDHADTIKAHYA